MTFPTQRRETARRSKLVFAGSLLLLVSSTFLLAQQPANPPAKQAASGMGVPAARIQRLYSGGSYGSSSDQRIHFGLGRAIN